MPNSNAIINSTLISTATNGKGSIRPNGYMPNNTAPNGATL